MAEEGNITAITLAKGESKTLTAEMMAQTYPGQEETNQLTSEIIGGWTEGFEQLFAGIGDEAIINTICGEMEFNIADQTRELTGQILMWLDEFEALDAITEPLHIWVEYLMNQDNQLIIDCGTNLGEMVADEADDENVKALLNDIGVILHMFRIYHGRECLEKWAQYIDKGFNEPEQFREFVIEEMM